MEVIKFFTFLVWVITLASCSNSPEFETGEIRTFTIVKEAIARNSSKKRYLDARNLINRKQIDRANVPVLFIELETGQNGTLTPYPGQGVSQTWLGADGATVTFDQGVLIASRGMGDDVMGGYTSKPDWSMTRNNSVYSRKLSYLNGRNQIFSQAFNCKIYKVKGRHSIILWEAEFYVRKYEENCHYGDKVIKNIYHVDDLEIVRKSRQYHSTTLGYIITERLDILKK